MSTVGTVVELMERAYRGIARVTMTPVMP
jgi:hypothetical protein